MMPFKPASRALSRFTVLDLSRVRSGPTAVRQLADWGANVIKVEMPEALEPGEKPGGPRHGPDFQNLHRNKRGLTLNLKSEAGREVLRRLVAEADVVVENFRPDVKHRLGIDYERLKSVNPRLVYASISGFGQDGPYRERPGFDQIAQGMGGLMSITGEPGQGPMRVGIPIADLAAGLYCASGILVALLAREETGEGQWVQTSLLQAQIAMLDFQATRWLMEGERPKQAGNNHPTMIPTGVFRTADGYINIAVTGQVIWERFCRAIDRPDLIAHADFKSAALRSRNRDALTDEINAALARQDGATWMRRFNDADVPSGPIYAIDEVFSDPQVMHLGVSQSIEAPALGRTITLLGQPVVLSGTPSALTVPPPEPGEHTDEILAEFGYSAEDIAALRREGTV
jgi:crotonobetainyl-CoA:carnitine CoA-transferase CaiB-like acyl-CoA transferase